MPWTLRRSFSKETSRKQCLKHVREPFASAHQPLGGQPFVWHSLISSHIPLVVAAASHTGLSVYTPQRSSQEISNKPVIAFLTDLGVSIATLTEERREDQPAIDAQVIPIPTHASPDSSASGQAAEPLGPPISLLVTRFHVLLLFPHHFVALNRLDYHISFQKQLSKVCI